MSYVVIKKFKDLKDNNHVYQVGDKYPRSGRVKKVRVEELSSDSNRLGKPLIQEVGEE